MIKACQVLALISCSLMQLSIAQPLDSLRTYAFLDGVIQSKLEDQHIAGATLAVIQDGKILFTKGYGYADVTARTPVDPASTLFRIGSVSKLFVWTGIMQLVAQGKLNLDTDINEYMHDVTVPPAYGKQVTLRHLLTHTPGFEDHILKLFARDSSGLKPLDQLLRDQMPSRVRPPFTQASYSNHGTAMAAYIIEKISGTDFSTYVEKNIIEPLGMTSTTFRQPLPPALARNMSKGYQNQNNRPEEKPFEYIPLYPVGAASSTATDLARLMMAYLNNGTFNEFELLDSATLAIMMAPAHRHHPHVNPMPLGFMDVSQNGVTILGHGGDTFWFHTGFFFLPEHSVGLIVSFNSEPKGAVYLDVLEAFMDEFFPDGRPLPPVLTTDAEFLKKFEGEYKGNRYSYDDVFKITSLFGRTRITAEDGKLKMQSGDKVTYLVAIDSTTFREEFKNDRIAFANDENGNISHAFIGHLPIFALDKVSGVDTMSFQLMVFVIVLLALLLGLLFWPIVAWTRRGYRAVDSKKKALPFVAKAVAWLNYLFVLLFLILFASAMSINFEIVYGLPNSLKVALVFPLLAIVTTLGMLVLFFRLVTQRHALRSKLYYAFLTLASVACLWQLYYWNYLGYHY